MEKAKMSEGTFTSELIEEMRSKIGLKLRVEDAVFNEEATRTAIRKFADGIGDPNPLWRSLEYARKPRYGEIAAPPSWVLSVLSAIQFGWRGIAEGLMVPVVAPHIIMQTMGIGRHGRGPVPSSVTLRLPRGIA